MWVPHYSDLAQPVYLMIADALEQDIGSGRLVAGERLPTLKDLAESLDVTPGTIGRAYDEAAKRGLVVGEVGRGTFVLPQPHLQNRAPVIQAKPVVSEHASDQIDLSIIKPNDAHMTDWLRRPTWRRYSTTSPMAAMRPTSRPVPPGSSAGCPRRVGSRWC
jgi:DNA-binding transcriptional regulator YhcF (GntR family)